jgi:hypothetical protein
MNTKEYIQSLFGAYEETAELNDFMEELQGNMDSRITSLIKKGMTGEDAFARVSAELGDITSLADEMSLKRRQEVYQDIYLGIRNYMNPWRVAAYVICGMILAFGIISALVAYLGVAGTAMKESGITESAAKTAAFGTLLLFLTAAVSGFTFLGATQETAVRYPLGKRRAALYTLAAALISFGASLFPLVYFAVEDHGLLPAFASEIPFLIPGGALLAFLALSEKDRLKPWAKNHYREEIKKNMETPAGSSCLGLFSGSIWIMAAGLFLLLGFIVSFKYSWLVFVFAIALQLFVQGVLQKPYIAQTDGQDGAK